MKLTIGAGTGPLKTTGGDGGGNPGWPGPPPGGTGRKPPEKPEGGGGIVDKSDRVAKLECVPAGALYASRRGHPGKHDVLYPVLAKLKVQVCGSEPVHRPVLACHDLTGTRAQTISQTSRARTWQIQ